MIPISKSSRSSVFRFSRHVAQRRGSIWRCLCWRAGRTCGDDAGGNGGGQFPRRLSGRDLDVVVFARAMLNQRGEAARGQEGRSSKAKSKGRQGLWRGRELATVGPLTWNPTGQSNPRAAWEREGNRGQRQARRRPPFQATSMMDAPRKYLGKSQRQDGVSGGGNERWGLPSGTWCGGSNRTGNRRREEGRGRREGNKNKRMSRRWKREEGRETSSSKRRQAERSIG
jgi:hypothetical protein